MLNLNQYFIFLCLKLSDIFFQLLLQKLLLQQQLFIIDQHLLQLQTIQLTLFLLDIELLLCIFILVLDFALLFLPLLIDLF